MLDANMEIDNLRQRLKFRNLNEMTIDSVCDAAASEISEVATNLLASAAEQAVQAGNDARSIDFINDINVSQHGHEFMIDTKSGKTDYSEPPFPMLPRLLKNAKTASDGSLYKVIPLRAKGTGSKVSGLTVTTEAALKSINEARMAAKQERDAAKGQFETNLSPDTMKGMSTFAALQAINSARKSFATMREKSTEPVMAFRTASSKQDPSAKWVMPRKKANMSNVLHDINNRLQYDLDLAIESIIKRYESMY